jgi:hypothetical protein
MDPSVVISFGKKNLQDTRNPTLLKPHLGRETPLPRAHVRERILGPTYRARLGQAIEQRPCGGCGVHLIADAPQRDEGTGLYGEEADGGHGMNEFKVPLISSNGKGFAVGGET